MGILRCSEVIGLPVISIGDGEKAGIVKDFIFDGSRRKVEALLIDRQGYRTKNEMVFLKDIIDIGKDAVMINTISKDTQIKKKNADNKFKFPDKEDIRGLRVYSKSGEELGEVKDALFDEKTGEIEGVEVSDGLLRDVIEGRKVLPLFGKVEFGQENLLVDREGIEEMSYTGGGIRKKLLDK